MFVIKVKRRNPNEKVTFDDVKKEAEVFHTQCHNGRVSWRSAPNHEGWRLACSRCKESINIGIRYSFPPFFFANNWEQRTRLAILKTVFDGRERQIKATNGIEKVIVVQKEEPK